MESKLCNHLTSGRNPTSVSPVTRSVFVVACPPRLWTLSSFLSGHSNQALGLALCLHPPATHRGQDRTRRGEWTGEGRGQCSCGHRVGSQSQPCPSLPPHPRPPIHPQGPRILSLTADLCFARPCQLRLGHQAVPRTLQSPAPHRVCERGRSGATEASEGGLRRAQVLVAQGNCDKEPPTEWLKTTESHSLAVHLEVWIQGAGSAVLPLRLQGQLLPAFSSFWGLSHHPTHRWASRCISPISACTLCLCL